jgi:hypothetical protein
MRSTSIPFIIAICLFCCDDAHDNGPLVGTWESDVTGGPDFGYDGIWRFVSDGDYQLAFGSVTIAGGTNRYSSGEYELISDSILVVHSVECENLGFNYAFSHAQDTLFVQIHDESFVSSSIRSVGPSQFERRGLLITWLKVE